MIFAYEALLSYESNQWNLKSIKQGWNTNFKDELDLNFINIIVRILHPNEPILEHIEKTNSLIFPKNTIAIYFGDEFNENIDKIKWPEYVEIIYFGKKFNKSLFRRKRDHKGNQLPINSWPQTLKWFGMTGQIYSNQIDISTFPEDCRFLLLKYQKY